MTFDPAEGPKHYGQPCRCHPPCLGHHYGSDLRCQNGGCTATWQRQQQRRTRCQGLWVQQGKRTRPMP